eukprot:GHVO01023677.1.p1 GENE.GHVO01023677.1~~GHVO01023677.1.p1  ORF type:complete len:306 (-),score=75.52 GHVO01023677.1:148-1065(-)
MIVKGFRGPSASVIISRVSCGGEHTAAITTTGLLYTWGHSVDGALGHGPIRSCDSPRIVSYFREASEMIVSVCCGHRHTVCVAVDNGGTKRGGSPNGPGNDWTRHAYAWGLGANGRLGLGRDLDSAVPYRVPIASGGGHASMVAAGGHHSAMVDAVGGLYLWGGGAFGKIGVGNEDDVLVPRHIPIPSACVTEDGRVYTWGKGENCGHSLYGESDHYRPMALRGLEGIISVSCGRNHSLAVGVGGDVWVWGNRVLKSSLGASTPTRLKGVEGKEAQSVACSHQSSFVLLSSDTGGGVQRRNTSAI